jgi:peptide/nickel transport system permease protein
MRSVLRRLLWLGPTLVLVTMVTFGALSVALPTPPEEHRLPLFFNPDPGAAERLATRAVARVAAGDAAAERELAVLGGAALPFILPALDSLSPEGRARTVRALRPVGARMGFDIDPTWEASREVLFWTRFWDEHSIDYRPVVARRAVLRFVQRSTLLRDTEVRQLDTYALEELIAHMTPVDGAADVDKVRRLSQLATDLSGGSGPRFRGDADLAEAARVAAAWTDWWSRERTRYKTYSGTERVTAMLRDTRYGVWVTQAVRRKLGLVEGGRSAWDVLREGARITLPLLGSGVVGVWVLSALAGAASALGKRGLGSLFRALGVLRAALPSVVIAVTLTWWWGDAARHTWVGVLLMLGAGASLSPLYRGALAEVARGDFIRTLRSLGAPRWQVSLTTLRLSSSAIIVQLGAQLSSLISLTFVVEYALGLPGLGTRTIEALHHPDLNWLMAITICTALFVGLLHATSELLLGALDPRWREVPKRLGGTA